MNPENMVQDVSFRVSLTAYRDGSREARVLVRLRDGQWFASAKQTWPPGAPTPAQLELLQAIVADELQKLILQECGVQGVLTAGQ